MSENRFLKTISSFFSLLERYFRYEVRGLERIPSKRCLVVRIHGEVVSAMARLAKSGSGR